MWHLPFQVCAIQEASTYWRIFLALKYDVLLLTKYFYLPPLIFLLRAVIKRQIKSLALRHELPASFSDSGNEVD